MKLKANICLDKLSQVGWVGGGGGGGWLEQLGIRLSQLPTKLKLKLKLKLSLATRLISIVSKPIKFVVNYFCS